MRRGKKGSNRGEGKHQRGSREGKEESSESTTTGGSPWPQLVAALRGIQSSLPHSSSSSSSSPARGFINRFPRHDRPPLGSDSTHLPTTPSIPPTSSAYFLRHPRLPVPTPRASCHGGRRAEGAAQRPPLLHVRLGSGGRPVPAAADAAGRRGHAGLRRRGRHPLLRRRRPDHLRARRPAGAARRGLR